MSIQRKKLCKAVIIADHVTTGAVAIGGINVMCNSAHNTVNAAIDAAPIDGRIKAAVKLGATVARVAVEVDCDRMVVEGLTARCRRDLWRLEQQ